MIKDVDILNYLKVKKYTFNYTNENLDQLGVERFCSLNNLCDYSITWVKNPDQTTSAKFEGHKHCLVVSKELLQFADNSNRCIITDEPKAIFLATRT